MSKLTQLVVDPTHTKMMSEISTRRYYPQSGAIYVTTLAKEPLIGPITAHYMMSNRSDSPSGALIDDNGVATQTGLHVETALIGHARQQLKPLRDAGKLAQSQTIILYLYTYFSPCFKCCKDLTIGYFNFKANPVTWDKHPVKLDTPHG
jgi:hypothetical protein